MSIPGSGSPLLLASTAAAAAVEYVIPKSLRFNSGDTSYLDKTFGSAGNRKTFTFSCWLKRAKLGVRQFIFEAGSSDTATDRFMIRFQADDTLIVTVGQATNRQTSQVFRDVGAWASLIVAVDTTASTANDRIKIYWNGSQITDFSSTSNPSQNANTAVSSAAAHSIGKTHIDNSNYFDGELADIQLVDGQALAPTDFGETRSSDGVWVPKEFSTFTLNPDGYNQVWSNGVAGTAFTTNIPIRSFDGSTSTWSAAANGGSLTWTPSATVTVSSSMRIYAAREGSNDNITVTFSDSSTFTSFDADNTFKWYTITGASGKTISTIAWSHNNTFSRVAAIEVDGQILTDASGFNSFHLNFSDSSTNEALGFDSAPTIPDLDPKKGMDVILYSGNNGTQNVGGALFEPGLVWVKGRSEVMQHRLVDVVRGNNKQLKSNSTAAQNTFDGLSINPDGFTVRNDANEQNKSGTNYVAWLWRAGGTAVANTDGTITSQVSASTDYGFSVVTWTGTASAGTIGHGLNGKVPKFIITKRRDSTGDWYSQHASLGATHRIQLNSTSAATSGTSLWNSTGPTGSVFSVGGDNEVNASGGTYVAYCWSEVSNYSKFGSWTGTGSAGLKVTTGFKPRWILIKKSNGSADWLILDTERGTDLGAGLYPNQNYAEASYDYADLLDDGFTLNTGDLVNANGDTYIYAAFADRPGNNWDVNNIVTNEGLTTSKTQFDVLTYTGNGTGQSIGQPVYSNETTGGNNTSNMFDGSGSSWNNLTAGNTITFTPSRAIACTQLDIWVDTDTPIRVNVNGGGYGSTFTQSGLGYVNITPGGGMTSLTSLLIDAPSGGGGSGAGIRGLRINGTTIVVDGDGGPGLKFQPDLVWIKSRSDAYGHVLHDTLRGANAQLVSNLTVAESSNAQYLTSFDSTGFSVGSNNAYNENADAYVAWCWKAGGTAVSNTDGTITSSVSANAQYGFSIVSYSGDGSGTANSDSGDSFGHGLNSAPKLVICKKRTGTNSWPVYHASTALGALTLDSTNALDTSSFLFAKKHPTNSVVYLGNNPEINKTGDDYIAYCFADVPGYQRIGSYVGNGSSTGPVVVTGFKPRFLLVKRIDSGTSDNWALLDNERDSTNPISKRLFPNLSNAESDASGNDVDFLANGFQPKNTNDHTNANGGNYIYLAIGDDEIGSDEDCLVDVPNAVTADADATDTTGGYQRGNYATMNPLHNPTGSSFSNGNLQVSNSGGWYSHTGTIGVASGKWYYEFEKTSGSYIGVGWRNDITTAGNPSFNANGGGIYLSHNGNKQSSAGSVGYGATWGSGDIVGVAFDCDAGTIEFYKNGVSQGQAFTGMTDGTFFPEVQIYQSGGVINFGQMRFKYPMPSGYAALNTTALPAATIEDGSAYFDVKTWTGNGGTQSISNLEFSPDLAWIKARGHLDPHALFDTVRGVQKRISSNLSNAEVTSSDGITSFNADGWTMGANGSNNANNLPYVGWIWDAGSSTVSNTDGSITSSVRASAASGFSIVSYTGSGSTATVGHGLNAALDFIIIKRRNTTGEWRSWHSSLSNTQGIDLNSTSAAFTDDSFNNTIPTSSVFTIKGGVANVNASSSTYIAYCFSAVAGYSAMGTWLGNFSSDGPFVYTGFRPAFLMWKNITNSGFNWGIIDSTRGPINYLSRTLNPNATNTESSRNTSDAFDFLSNGFKVRASGSNARNQSGSTFIWIAFAENPFQANGGLAR